MKKILALLLAITLVASLCACSGGGDPVDQNEAFASTDKYRNYYQIFIGSFCDSNDDEIGDFQGIISKMDYLNDGDPNSGDDLGIDGIWLSPMMPSQSYHKYNVADYFNIDEDFGTLDDFDQFLKLAHERGIKVIIDLVLNHSGNDHEFFKKACEELKDDKTDGYARYYHFSPEKTNICTRSAPGSRYFYQGDFDTTMPDWNLDFQGTRDYFEEVAKFWLDRGVDGFRLDAVKYFDDSDTDGVEFLKWFYEMAQGINPDVYMVGEDWDGAASIYRYYESGIDSLFNFRFGDSGGEYVTASHGMVEDMVKQLKKYEDNIHEHNEKAINANFLTNHDMVRVMNMLDMEEMKVAACLYMLSPGNSFTYYGEEIGIESAETYDDGFKRTAMIWDNDNLPEIYVNGEPDVEKCEYGGVKQQLEEENSLLKVYQKLIKIKNQNPTIARGRISETVSFDDMRCAGYIVEDEKAKLLIVHNGDKEDKELSLDMVKNPTLRGSIVAGLSDDEKKDAENASMTEVTLSGATLKMPARSSAVLLVE